MSNDRYLDGMAIVRHLGKPSLFITMTCNPAWDEIRMALLPGQKPEDRPDIVARVFHVKLRKLMDDITKNGVFGRTVGILEVIEFQKRGMCPCLSSAPNLGMCLVHLLSSQHVKYTAW